MDTNHLPGFENVAIIVVHILLTETSINKLCRDGCNNSVIKCDMLKVPHHGSRSSLLRKFYENCDPQAAVISVGNNQFGHPHPEVVNELHVRVLKYTVTIIRCDRCTSDGMIQNEPIL